MEGGPATLTSDLGVGTAFQEGLGYLDLVLGRGVMERGPAVLVELIGVGLVFEQHGNQGRIATFHREVHQRALAGIHLVRIGLRLEQNDCDLGLVAQDGLLERAEGRILARVHALRARHDMAVHVGEVAPRDGFIDRLVVRRPGCLGDR